MLLGSVGALVDAVAAPNLVIFVSFVTLAAAGMGLCLANLLTLALNCLPSDRQGSGSAVIGAGQALIAALVSPLAGLGAGSAAAASPPPTRKQNPAKDPVQPHEWFRHEPPLAPASSSGFRSRIAEKVQQDAPQRPGNPILPM